MAEGIVRNKSFDFAKKVIGLNKILIDRKEFVLSKQFLRSETSVGANVREAVNGQSKGDFIHKLAIAQKECDETLYWLELLIETNFIIEDEFIEIYADATSLLKIIKSIIITSKSHS